MIEEEEKKEIERKVSFDFKKLETFLFENKQFVEDEAAAGIFSLGVLVSLVFNMQQARLNSTPFEKKLKGLHVTAKDVERIFNEAVEKVNQYAFQSTYRDLREFIAGKLTVNNPEIQKMSNQKISFNFVCGLELGRKFKTEKVTN